MSFSTRPVFLMALLWGLCATQPLAASDARRTATPTGDGRDDVRKEVRAAAADVQAFLLRHSEGLVERLGPLARTLVTAGAIAFVVVVGSYLTRPIFRFIAMAHLRELFTAAALLMVIAIALLMVVVGLNGKVLPLVFVVYDSDELFGVLYRSSQWKMS